VANIGEPLIDISCACARGELMGGRRSFGYAGGVWTTKARRGRRPRSTKVARGALACAPVFVLRGPDSSPGQPLVVDVGLGAATEIGTEEGLLGVSKRAILDVIGNPSLLRSFAHRTSAHPPSRILPQVHCLVKWVGIWDWSRRGLFIE
jgi:hypothetical protein